MDGCFSTVHENDLSASGWWTALGWVVFALKGKSTDIIPKTPKDWLTDLPLSSDFDSYWSLCLNPVCSRSELPTLALSLLCSRLGWDWNHHRPVKPHIMLEAVWCFGHKQRRSPQKCFAVFTPARFRSGSRSREKTCRRMMLTWHHRVNGVTMSWTKDGTISNVVALTASFSVRAGRIITHFQLAVRVTVRYCIFDCLLSKSCPHSEREAAEVIPLPKGYRDWTLKCLVLVSFIRNVHRFYVP